MHDISSSYIILFYKHRIFIRIIFRNFAKMEEIENYLRYLQSVRKIWPDPKIENIFCFLSANIINEPQQLGNCVRIGLHIRTGTST